MSRNRLLVFSPLYPPHIGGLESHAEQFNEHMSKVGYRITVFTPLIIPDSASFENKDGVNIIRFPAFEIIPNYPVPKFWEPLFWRQWRLIWDQPTDLVISRTRFFLTSLLALVYSKIKRKPWLHIEHGSDYVHLTNTFTSFIARTYDQTIGRLVFMTADKMVANSRASAIFTKTLAPNRDINVIYRGVNQDLIEQIQENRSFRHANQDKFIIGYCGRLIDGKGVSDLLTAIAMANKPSILCMIIGDGPQRKILNELAKSLNIEKQVIFLGELPWSKAISYVKIADLVINPSYTEGLPTSLIEAALCKRAIIATNVGGTPEIIEHERSGILYPSGDISSLARYILRFFNDHTLCRHMGNVSFENTSNKFSWDKTIKSYIDVFQLL